jgi:hypothetical protein
VGLIDCSSGGNVAQVTISSGPRLSNTLCRGDQARELGQAVSWPVPYLTAGPERVQARVPVDLKNLRSCFEEQHAAPQL